MRPDHGSAEFEEIVRPLVDRLVRTALLLCGDWQLAEDLVQNALATFYAKGRWRSVDHPQAYLRQSLTNGFLSSRRRPAAGEVSVEVVPDSLRGHWQDVGSELRIDLFRALTQLNPAERAVVVLRYWEDLSVHDTAATLGCSEGAVRTRSSRALAKLRALLGASDSLPEELVPGHGLRHREVPR